MSGWNQLDDKSIKLNLSIGSMIFMLDDINGRDNGKYKPIATNETDNGKAKIAPGRNRGAGQTVVT